MELTAFNGSQPDIARYWMFVAFLVILACLGGASRADAYPQAVIRGMALAFIVYCWIVNGSDGYRQMRWPLGILAALALLMIAQLVPLPPSAFSALSGRKAYADAALAAGLPSVWRPLSMSPMLTYNSLFSLFVPLATLLGLASLNPSQRAALISPILAIVVASGLLALAQRSAGSGTILQFYEHSEQGAPGGLFANRNHQALLLAMSLPLAAFWAARAQQTAHDASRHLLVGAVGVALLVILIPVTGSRAGLFLGGLALIPALAILMWPLRDYLGRAPFKVRMGGILGVMACLAILIYVSVSFQQAEAVRRLFALDATADLRTQALPTVLTMTRDFFPAGGGFGSFESLYRTYEPVTTLTPVYLNQAHDDQLQFLLEGGLAGAILLAAVILWWAVSTTSLWMTRKPTNVARLGRLGSGLLLLLFVASFVDYPARTPFMMALAAIYMSWMIPAGDDERNAQAALPSGPQDI